jgi:hypothetical protein
MIISISAALNTHARTRSPSCGRNAEWHNELSSQSACACRRGGALQIFLLQTELKADKLFIEI